MFSSATNRASREACEQRVEYRDQIYMMHFSASLDNIVSYQEKISGKVSRPFAAAAVQQSSPKGVPVGNRFVRQDVLIEEQPQGRKNVSIRNYVDPYGNSKPLDLADFSYDTEYGNVGSESMDSIRRITVMERSEKE